MVATSQRLATAAGVRMLADGGTAADAAVAAAAVLCVAEPMSTGVGGDAFALVWRDGRAEGLDAAGPAPADADPAAPVADYGPASVTAPGAVAGWAALLERHGRRGLDACLGAAIDLAEDGLAVGPRTAELWRDAERPPPLPARLRSPELAATLRRIAESGPDGFYAGPVAEAIAGATWLAPSDLEAVAARWVEPLRLRYRGAEVLELPAPTQGIAALEGLGVLERLDGTGLREQVHAVRAALADAFAHVRDGADVGFLLGEDHLRRRAREPVAAAAPAPGGGTVYLCAVDESGMAVSFIQSLYGHFGSGVSAPGTGVLLNNRAACFAVDGRVTPGRRPYHTLIPGLLARDGELLGPFGITGGFNQPQAHVQLVSAVIDDGCDPQAALDRPRFRVDGERVLLEPGLAEQARAVRAPGLQPVVEPSILPFGGGQAILVQDGELRGGSDRRRDGCAAAA